MNRRIEDERLPKGVHIHRIHPISAVGAKGMREFSASYIYRFKFAQHHHRFYLTHQVI